MQLRKTSRRLTGHCNRSPPANNQQLRNFWKWQTGDVMGDTSRRTRLYAGVSLSALILVLSAGGSAKAESNDPEVKALKAQVEQLTRTVNRLMEAQTQNAADAKAAKKQASQAEAQAAQAKA